MNYFEILGISFGFLAFLKPFYMHILPWNEMKGIEKAYAEKRPTWVIPTAIAGILLVAFTWYKEVTTAIPYSILITLLFSLTLVKAVYFLFDYKKFQQWVSGMLKRERGKQIILVDIGASAFGLILIVVSVLVF